MRAGRVLRATLCSIWIAGSGCTTLREIPREEVAARPEKLTVRVTTTDGLVYELESARIEADTLVGYHRVDVEGPVEEFTTLKLPLDQVRTIGARRIDWYRTGLVGGLSLAAVVAAGLSAKNKNKGGGGVPCEREPGLPQP